jgi:hypothetical protein
MNPGSPPTSSRRWPRRLLKGVLIVAGVWLAAEGAWWATLHGRVDQPLADANRIVVRVDGDTAVNFKKQITDPAVITRIRAYIEARPGGWRKTWHTPPVTWVHAAFYRDSSVVGWFAAGSNFLQAPTLDGPAAMRNADPAELEELNRLLGAPPGSHLGPSRGPYPDHRH